MKYGLPYKGSKNKIAGRIIDLLPARTHLFDLFCGGCAVSHAALAKGKFEHAHINDLDPRPVRLFMDALQGKYKDETRWISREDFFRLKDEDPYVAICWCFGNDMRSYMYSRTLEPLKRAYHYAIVFRDYEPASAFGLDLAFMDHIDSVRERRIALWRFIKKNVAQLRPYGFPIQSLDSLDSLESLQRLKRLQRLQSLQRLKKKITSSTEDYANVEIPENSVIYCDIPYKGTNPYPVSADFDYERFYDWACRQTEPVFISSYEMPEDKFECVAEFSHLCCIASPMSKKVTERIFVPKGQTERGNQPTK